ncbi:MAG: aldehyde dehydrogenase [Actinomycetota bacterium]|nr:MAG: aldehyde dehydrogenase [Actinomycetota bacterium]
MFERHGMFIDNQLTPSAGEELDVVSPATEERIGRVTLATKAEIDRAAASARQAFDAGPWPRMAVEERRAVIAKAADVLRPQAAELSELVTKENGIIIRYQQGNVAHEFGYYGNLPYPEPVARQIPGEADATIVKEPAGVVAAIVPWNAPVPLALEKVIPALLAGCTVVLKPSPETPLQDYVFAEAFREAGLPPGVLNVVPADREVSEHLVRSRDVDLVSFTGSTAAGRKIGAICGEQLKRAILELGGKSAAIVLDDADLDELAAMVLHTGMLLNNGEGCINWARILVPRSRHDEMVEAFCGVLEQVKVGDPLDPATDIGPLVAERQRDRVEGYIRSGLGEGAKIAFGGGRPAGLTKGWFVEPTLVVGADNGMRLCREEIFGPVGTVIPYDDDEDALRIANDTNYGLGGAVFTGDLDRGRALAGRIRAGTVGVNAFGVGHELPFGGYKDSGIGRSHGPEGLLEYFETKTIALPSTSGVAASAIGAATIARSGADSPS